MAFSNPVSPEDNLDSIAVPLFDTLQAISYGEVGDIRLYDVGTLFWSLSRLFGCYERVITGLQYPRQQRHFLDLDLENFIIRQRVVLNDIAYIVRQLLPKDARSMGKPKGGKHPANREYSVTTLVKDLGKNSQSFPEISSAFANASEWINELKNGRDCIIHYKAKIVIFKGDPVGFAFSDPGNTAPRQSSPTGGQ